MGNIQLKKNRVYKTFKEIAQKQPPILKLEENSLYQKRISKIYSETLSLDIQIQQFLDSQSTNCSSTKDSFGSTIQGLEDDLKAPIHSNQIPQNQYQNKSIQESLKNLQTNKLQMNRHRNAYYNCLGINQQQKEEEGINKQIEIDEFLEGSIKKLITKQKRNIYEATTYLVRLGALKKL